VLVLGLDIGSTYIKCALLQDGYIVGLEKTETSYDPLEKCKSFIKTYQPDKIIATGYGRHLVKENFNNIEVITEIKAFSIGAKFINPRVRTIIDIGGQDTKVIALSEEGKIIKFEMNDKCSAGTGRFLEIMVKTLGYSLEEVTSLSIEGKDLKVKINSMCTVFAESEVISMIAKGMDRKEILKAVHFAIAHRVAGMAKRIPLKDEVMLAGGCAGNQLLKTFLEKEINKNIVISSVSPFLGAIGAALYGST